MTSLETLIVRAAAIAKVLNIPPGSAKLLMALYDRPTMIHTDRLLLICGLEGASEKLMSVHATGARKSSIGMGLYCRNFHYGLTDRAREKIALALVDARQALAG